MFEFLEKLIKKEDLVLSIMEERYGDGILIGLDIDSKLQLHDLIIAATRPDDVEAVDVLCGLYEAQEEFPMFLYSNTHTLEEGLRQLNQKAEQWLLSSDVEKKEILEKINTLYSKLEKS